MEWVETKNILPEINVLVALININAVQNKISGDYPVGYLGHLANFGGCYWSCHGQAAIRLEYFTHWAALPGMPKEFLDQFIDE